MLAQFIGLTTALQLLEISRPDSPLLNYFLQRAPGTYQHSLQVANLAEQAAESVHADALLTKVGALFHDVGKAANPLFFVENQPPSQVDSHDDMKPEVSAQTIIRHVSDGLELARKYRLPRRLQDFIAEHHGTFITGYQYNRALRAANGDKSKVDELAFRYPALLCGVILIRKKNRPSVNLKTVLFSGTAVFLVLLFSELTLQVFVRLVPAFDRFLSGKAVSQAIPDEKFGNLPNPLFPGHDSNGFRNRKALTRAEIVAIGDSFTYGIRVELDQTWPYQLEHLAGRFTICHLGGMAV